MELSSWLNTIAQASPSVILAVVLYFCNRERMAAQEKYPPLLERVLEALGKSAEAQKLLGEALGRKQL